jgi:hypothetical protein
VRVSFNKREKIFNVKEALGCSRIFNSLTFLRERNGNDVVDLGKIAEIDAKQPHNVEGNSESNEVTL